MSEVRVKLVDGSERTGRWVTLEEWMAPLDKDHPARKELHVLRTNLGRAMVQIDKLERENASLHQQFREQTLAIEQPKDQDERTTAGGLHPKTVLRETPHDAGNPFPQAPGPEGSVE